MTVRRLQQTLRPRPHTLWTHAQTLFAGAQTVLTGENSLCTSAQIMSTGQQPCCRPQHKGLIALSIVQRAPTKVFAYRTLCCRRGHRVLTSTQIHRGLHTIHLAAGQVLRSDGNGLTGWRQGERRIAHREWREEASRAPGKSEIPDGISIEGTIGEFCVYRLS